MSEVTGAGHQLWTPAVCAWTSMTRRLHGEPETRRATSPDDAHTALKHGDYQICARSLLTKDDSQAETFRSREEL